MKKNKMMRIASVLLIAVLLSTCVISGTFAKYVTSGSVADQARVAKFGVVVTGSGSLFAENYWYVDGLAGNQPSDHTGEGNHDSDTPGLLTVESSDGANLVAPGTQNDTGVTFTLSGTPEVDVKIKLSVVDFKDIYLNAGTYLDMTTSDAKWDTFEFEGNPYRPVVFTLKNGLGETIVSGTIDDVKWYLENVYEVYVDANTNLNAPQYTFTLTWKWAFDGEQVLNGQNVYSAKTVDCADTLLGDLVALRMGAMEDATNETLWGYINDGKAGLDISVKMSLTVTQVD